jgi:hypothetical protein
VRRFRGAPERGHAARSFFCSSIHPSSTRSWASGGPISPTVARRDRVPEAACRRRRAQSRLATELLRRIFSVCGPAGAVT